VGAAKKNEAHSNSRGKKNGDIVNLDELVIIGKIDMPNNRLRQNRFSVALMISLRHKVAPTLTLVYEYLYDNEYALKNYQAERINQFLLLTT